MKPIRNSGFDRSEASKNQLGPEGKFREDQESVKLENRIKLIGGIGELTESFKKKCNGEGNPMERTSTFHEIHENLDTICCSLNVKSIVSFQSTRAKNTKLVNILIF